MIRDPGNTNHFTMCPALPCLSCRLSTLAVRCVGSSTLCMIWVFNGEYFWYLQGDDNGEAGSRHLDLCRSP